MNVAQKFTGPAEFAVYGGPHGGPFARISGHATLEQCEDFIFSHRKAHPDWTYEVWQAGGWKKVTT